MDPHIRGTGGGGAPTSESGSSSSASEPTRKAMAHLHKRVDEWAQDRYVGPRAERVTVKDLLANRRDKGPSVRTDSDGEHFEG
jgi:hypothetical protein